MKITFDNEADTAVIVTLQGTDIINEVIAKGERKEFELFAECSKLTVIPEGKSDVTYLLAKFGIVLKRFFKTASHYTFTAQDNMEILLLTDKKRGSFADEYERVVPFSNQSRFALVRYSVSDEVRMKGILEEAINKGDKSLKIFDAFDILGNAFTGLLLLIIPFILIWVFGDIHLAVKICGTAYIPIFIIIILMNRFFDKVKRKLWKRAKGFTLRKQIFKDYNSYFEDEYIKSVFDKK